MDSTNERDFTVPERIKDKVPDYEGYLEIKHRRKSDELLRSYLKTKLHELVEELARCSDRFKDEEQLKICESLAKIEHKLITIGESLDNPIYLQSSFFEKKDLSEEFLSNLNSHEIIMFAEVTNLSEEINDLMQNPINQPDMKEQLLRLDDAIDAFNQALFERELLLEGSGEDM